MIKLRMAIIDAIPFVDRVRWIIFCKLLKSNLSIKEFIVQSGISYRKLVRIILTDSDIELRTLSDCMYTLGFDLRFDLIRK